MSMERPLLSTNASSVLPQRLLQQQPQRRIDLLSFCLVMDNPFFNPTSRGVDENLLLPRDVKRGQVRPYLEDTDLPCIDQEVAAQNANVVLKRLQDTASKVRPVGAPNASSPASAASRPVATRFQKVIDIILRLQARKFTLDPPNMLRLRDELTDGPSQSLPNEFAGWVLVEDHLFLSQDKDEMNIRITASDDMLLECASEQGIYLNTHPYSFAGGAPQAYNLSVEMKLRESVETFLIAFPEPDPKNSNARVRGFILDTPDRSRITLRLLREPWKYAGCGISLAEMRKNNVLVRNFFPLHNPQHATELGLDAWGSIGQVFSRNPLAYNENAVLEYFGEDVAMYFTWMTQMTKTMSILAVLGILFGVIGLVVTTKEDKDLSNGIFSFVCVLWGVMWNVRWLRLEALFALSHGQDAQMSQELVRDEFEPTEERPVTSTDIFNMKFDVPLTLRRLADGTMVNLMSDAARRRCIRYGLAYPTIIIITFAMVVVMCLLTWWRFLNPYNGMVSSASSALSIMCGSLFGALFEAAASKFNELENNRTESEEHSQKIGKNFLFTFFSKYFTFFSIMLWPTDLGAVSIQNTDRQGQLQTQLIMTCIVKPVIQQIKEIARPWLMFQIRVRGDMNGGSAVKGLLSLIKRETIDTELVAHTEVEASVEDRRRSLWLEAQMEPFESASDDYLEVVMQYGYMIIFAAILPWAAVALFVTNVLEIRVDAWKLLKFHQRPLARPASSIGAWNAICFFMLSVALCTNSYLVSVVTDFRTHFVSLNQTTVCLNQTAVCLNQTAVCLNQTAVCLNQTAVCLNQTAVCLNQTAVCLNQTVVCSDDTLTKYATLAVVQYILLAAIFGVFAVFGRASNQMLRIKAKQSLLSNFSTRKRLQNAIELLALAKSGGGGIGNCVMTRSTADPRMFDADVV